KVGNFFQPFLLRKMNDKRIEAWPSFGFENFRDRNWIERVGSEPINRFGRKRDRFALAQQFNRRLAVGRNFRFHFGSLAERTLSDCFLRNASNFCRIFSSEVARIATARRAAFFAPAVPIASVPTGIPPGICAVERSESSPFNSDDGIGTPKTGNQVRPAIAPAKCPAAPAPAMITGNPPL